MPTYQVRVAAAVAVIGADLFTGEVWARTPRNRIFSGFACVGSAALADTEVDLMLDELRIGNFFNSRTGVTSPNKDDLMPVGNLYIPAGALLRCLVRDAATTNPVGLLIILQDMAARR